MTTLADSLVSSSTRTLAIRKRPDLTAKRHRYQGRSYWIVKEPVNLQYYRFEEEEFAILNMLDGKSSLDDIAEKFEAQFPPQTIKVEELQSFIGMLHRSSLIISGTPGQGEQLKKRRDERKNKERLALFSNILSMRFKGIDPDRFMNKLYPYVRWFFTKTCLILCCLLALSALTLVLVQFEDFQARLPSFHTFFDSKNWFWLGLVLSVTKIIHEFGHGLSCKHFGGECHEMGVMFLVLTPCLYCNVSDSWMLPSRFHRAAIGAAGMYVEIVLASLCTFLWWFSNPGPLNYVCLNVMFVSSVSTIMFNANPLLRYDGYYILSDLMEIPNLRQKASSILNRKMGAWFLGLEQPEDPFLPKRNHLFFAVFTVASALYRWVVVLSILMFLNKVFEPYGLKVLGQLIALGSIYGLLVQPFWKLFKFFRIPGRLGKVKLVRMYSSLAGLAAIIIAVLYIPFPSHIYCALELSPQDTKWVYIQVDGVLKERMVKAGDKVSKGDVLATLFNPQLNLEVARLTGQLNETQSRLEVHRVVSHYDDTAAEQIPQLEKTIESYKELLAQKQKDIAHLTILAPRDGYVIPPTYNKPRENNGEQLPHWSGTPLDKQNLGATLQRSTPFCQIGDPNLLEAHLIIDHDDVGFLRRADLDYTVEIILDQSSEETFFTTINSDNLAQTPLKQTPPRLSSLNHGPVATKMSAEGAPIPLSSSFRATVLLDSKGKNLRPGLTGVAKITTANRTLGQRMFRYASKTFNFDL